MPVSRKKSGKKPRRVSPKPVGRAPEVPLWGPGADGMVETNVEPVFWEPAGDGSVDCNLCYRKCTLAEGEAGPCGFRRNAGGRVELVGHGQITSVVRQIRGFGPDPFLTYKPGATSLFLGGVRCTARCTFCMSTDIVWKPENLPWAAPPDRAVGGDSAWYGARAFLHPVDAVDAAKQAGATQILFGINEPTLSLEWTYDVARLAKRAGMDVCVETNGFTTAEAIRYLGPYVDAVDVGTKGSADPEFYARRMKSPGAVPAVLESLKHWRDAGVHVIVGDLVAPPYMQDDTVFEESARRFYDHVAAVLGELTPVLTTPIAAPGPMTDGPPAGMLVGRGGGEPAYVERIGRSLELARSAGLPYVHDKQALDQTISCHGCGGALLEFRERCTAGWYASDLSDDNPCVMARSYCPWWRVRTHVTDSKCDHCGVRVPIVALAPGRQASARCLVEREARAAGLAPMPEG
jgi:pyruvate formate lyase activating enzyme